MSDSYLIAVAVFLFIAVLAVFLVVYFFGTKAGFSIDIARLFRARMWGSRSERSQSNAGRNLEGSAGRTTRPITNGATTPTASSDIPSLSATYVPQSSTGVDSLHDVEPLSTLDLRLAANFRTFDSEPPPVGQAWVGREAELSDLISPNGGVVAITGIGGEGKSSLAAEALRRWLANNPDGFWDWRNCREKGDRFPSQLASMILRVSCGKIHPSSQAVENDLQQRIYFRLTRGHSGIIVLDNVDHYVDTENELLTSSIGAFVDEALRQASKLTIIITCRPRITYADPRFREFHVTGLTDREAHELFHILKVPSAVASPSDISLMHKATAGHAFWLTLLASELRRKPDSAKALIRSVASGSGEERTLYAMLSPVWHNLNEREQLLLNVLCEIGRPVNERYLQSFVSDRIPSPNQFSRAMRAVTNLGLAIKKSYGHGAARYETHPVVNEYISKSLGASERRTFSELVVIKTTSFSEGVCNEDSFASLDAEFVELAVANIEATVRLGNTSLAAKSLAAISIGCKAKGLTVELVRVCDQIVDTIDWKAAKQEGSPLHDFALAAVDLYACAGFPDRFREVARRYEPYSRAATPHKIRWADALCSAEWKSGNFTDAIRHGEHGVKLKQSGIDTAVDASYSLALAYRDAGFGEKALPVFLRDASVESLLEENYLISKRGHADYGNIGRCLFFSGDLDRALKFYAMSWRLIDARTGDPQNIENRGYAALWFAEVFIARGDFQNAATFLNMASADWRGRFPSHLPKVERARQTLPERLRETSQTDHEKCAKTCEDLVAGVLRQFIDRRQLPN